MNLILGYCFILVDCHRQVKSQLAEKAVQAAKAAQVALAGKESIVEQLRQEIKEAEAVVREEASALEQTRSIVNSAVLSASQAQQEARCSDSVFFSFFFMSIVNI